MIHVVLTVAALFAALGQVLLKLGAHGREGLLAFANPWVLAGLSAYGLSTLLWLHGLAKLPLRVVYPYTALTFVCVYLAAFFVFGERPSLRGLIGVGLIMVGLGLIAAD